MGVPVQQPMMGGMPGMMQPPQMPGMEAQSTDPVDSSLEVRGTSWTDAADKMIAGLQAKNVFLDSIATIDAFTNGPGSYIFVSFYSSSYKP